MAKFEALYQKNCEKGEKIPFKAAGPFNEI
jgi:hypothetical protein